MAWIDNLNSIMEYVENHLDDELDTDEISRLAACPYAMFQRVFAIIATVSFAEYVRNRRLTRAAYELKHTKKRLIDIALQYGYESPDAFSAAFRRVMGASPSQVRREQITHNEHPPLRFKLSIIGVNEMTEIIKTYKQSMPAVRFIGQKYFDEDRVNGSFSTQWCEWMQNNRFTAIENAPGYRSNFFEDSDAYIGLMRSKNGEPFEYWIGMFAPEETTVPEGLECVDFSASTLGVCWIHGKEQEVFCKDDLVLEAYRENNIKPVTDRNGALWFFERYVCPRFTTPDETGAIILDHCYYVEG